MSININLHYTDSIKELLSKGKIIHYLDFNVANYLYSNKYSEADLSKFVFYSDSTAIFSYLKHFNKSIRWQNSTDMLFDLLRYLDKHNKKVFFFGDKEEVLNKVKEEIRNNYSGIINLGTQDGYNYDNKEILELINHNETDILFVGLGVGRQEKWLNENSHKLNVKNIICVGGWFQYLANEKKRAPLFIRRIHLEWLFKLITEFSRVWDRYIFGIPLFYWRLLTKQITLILIRDESPNI